MNSMLRCPLPGKLTMSIGRSMPGHSTVPLITPARSVPVGDRMSLANAEGEVAAWWIPLSSLLVS